MYIDMLFHILNTDDRILTINFTLKLRWVIDVIC